MSLRSAVRFVFNTSLTSVMFSCSVAINKHCLSVWALQETSVSCRDTNLHGLPLRLQNFLFLEQINKQDIDKANIMCTSTSKIF